MVDILLLQTVSILIASAGVFLAAIYYILQIRHQTRIRQTDLIVRITPWFNLNPEKFAEVANILMTLRYKDYNDFVQKYGSLYSGKPEVNAIRMLTNWGNGVGILFKRKLIDIDIVYDAYGDAVRLFWEKIKPLIEGYRKEINDPHVWSSLEYLANEMKKREQKLRQEGAKSG